MKNWIVRTNCEYSIEVAAETPDAAIAKANQTDLANWMQAWAVNEAEETEED